MFVSRTLWKVKDLEWADENMVGFVMALLEIKVSIFTSVFNSRQSCFTMPVSCHCARYSNCFATVSHNRGSQDKMKVKTLRTMACHPFLLFAKHGQPLAVLSFGFFASGVG